MRVPGGTRHKNNIFFSFLKYPRKIKQTLVLFGKYEILPRFSAYNPPAKQRLHALPFVSMPCALPPRESFHFISIIVLQRLY